MKYTFSVIFILFVLFGAFSQDLAELDRRGGFKDIKLLHQVGDYEDLEFKKDIKDNRYPGAKLYTAIKGTYSEIGSLKVHKLEVKAYKGQIYEIVVEAEKSIGLYRGLVTAYGEPKYSHRAKKNYWQTENIKLWYSIKGKEKILLEYYSLAMEDVRKKEKEKNLKDVVDDF